MDTKYISVKKLVKFDNCGYKLFYMGNCQKVQKRKYAKLVRKAQHDDSQVDIIVEKFSAKKRLSHAQEFSQLTKTMQTVAQFLPQNNRLSMQQCNKMCYEQVVPTCQKSWKMVSIEDKLQHGLDSKLKEMQLSSTYFLEMCSK